MSPRTFAAINAKYMVADDGSVWSEQFWRGTKYRQLAAHPNSDGYLRVRVILNGRRVVRLVHSLVAIHFLGPRPTPNHEVRHLDGNKLNNVVANLAWGTEKDNADDRERHGRTSRGEKHSAALKRGYAKARGET